MHNAFDLISKKAIVCSCGRLPTFMDMPTIQGRSMHFLECKCGEKGVIIYDGEMYSEEFINMTIKGWNKRKEFKNNGITEISMIK